ncbi:MAG: helix-turn-helix transcriptional regulator [Spirochaetes bacterium]|nr:helix-turn-helix transcriptional regulator [Spirochaetota bacterium]
MDSGEKHLSVNGKISILKKNDLFFIPPYLPHASYVKDGKTAGYTIICFDDIEKTSEKMIVNDLPFSSSEMNSIRSLYRFAIMKAGNYDNSDIMINKLVKYIDENCSEQLSTDSLAAVIGLNPYYLLHLFKEKIGISLHQYIIQARIKKSKEYFLSEKSILDIALDSGFYDQSHYIRNFKRHVGITPQRYFESITVI